MNGSEFPIDKLGPYPLLQIAAAIVVLAGLALAVYRGSRDRSLPRPAPPSIPNEQRYFFDGPIGEALKLLRDIRNVQNEIKEHVEPLGELGRAGNKELGEIKDKVDAIHATKLTRRR